MEPPCYHDAHRGGQLSTEGPPGLPNRLKSAAVRCRLIITVWEYLSTANVGGDPDVVSEMLHRDPPAPALAQKNLRAGGRTRMWRREAQRRRSSRSDLAVSGSFEKHSLVGYLAFGSRPFSTRMGGLRCFVACSYAKAQPMRSPSLHGRAEISSPKGSPSS